MTIYTHQTPRARHQNGIRSKFSLPALPTSPLEGSRRGKPQDMKRGWRRQMTIIVKSGQIEFLIRSDIFTQVCIRRQPQRGEGRKRHLDPFSICLACLRFLWGEYFPFSNTIPKCIVCQIQTRSLHQSKRAACGQIGDKLTFVLRVGCPKMSRESLGTFKKLHPTIQDSSSEEIFGLINVRSLLPMLKLSNEACLRKSRNEEDLETFIWQSWQLWWEYPL